MRYIQALAQALVLLVGIFTPTGASAAQAIEEGFDYTRVSKPLAVATGKQIEVVEFFWYRSPHCGKLPALQPAYAAAIGFLIVRCFVLFHPEGRGIRKAINVQLHRGIGTVEKLYADAGGLKGEINAVSAGVVKSFNSLGLLQGSENKK